MSQCFPLTCVAHYSTLQHAVCIDILPETVPCAMLFLCDASGWEVTSSSHSYCDVYLVQHAAHQHGITHDSQLGSMLYAEDLDSILYSNTTAANSTVQALSQHNVNPEVPLMTDHTTTVDLPVSSRSSSRRELPTRTHHQAHQTAELP